MPEYNPISGKNTQLTLQSYNCEFQYIPQNCMFSLWPNKGTLFVLAGVALSTECWKWSTYLTYVDH